MHREHRHRGGILPRRGDPREPRRRRGRARRRLHALLDGLVVAV